MRTQGVSTTILLDGFTITGGNIEGAGASNNQGAGFVPDNTLVLIGGQVCSNLSHDPASPMTKLTCITPPGSGIDQPVVIVVGSRATSALSFDYVGSADPSLLAHWRLDDGSGNIAADSSGNNHPGTLINGPIWVSDAAPTPSGYPGALAFDGVNDSVQIGNPAVLNFAGQITLAAWVKPQATDGIRNILDHGSRRVLNQEVFCESTLAGIRLAPGLGPTTWRPQPSQPAI